MLSHIIWLCLIQASYTESYIPRFIGDVIVEQYILTHFTNLQNSQHNHKIYLINNLALDSTATLFNNNKTSPLSAIFQNNNILHVYLSSMNASEITKVLPRTSEYNSIETTVIIEQTFSAEMMNSTTRAFFKALNQIYNHCHSCRPLIVVVNVELELLYNFLLQNSLTNLQAVFVSTIKTSKVSSLHLNPILHGCILYRGIYVPKTKVNFALLSLSYWQCDLNQMTLNVSVSHWMPFCNVKRNSNKSISLHFSMEYELLKILEKNYNFTTALVDGKDSWGMERNGRWVGMVGQVLYGSNMALCGIGRRKERLQVVDFSAHISVDEITYFLQSPELAKRNWIFNKPFSRLIWLFIVVTFIAFTFLLNAVALMPWGNAIFLLYAICINQSTHAVINESSAFIRKMYAVWMLASLILASSYSSCFYSFLTISEYESTIDSLEKLENAALHDSIYILTWNSSSYLSQFIHADKENRFYHNVGLHINRTKQRMIANESDQFHLAESSRENVVITSRVYAGKYYHNATKNPLYVGRENLENLYTGMVLPKRSPLMKPFNKIIYRMQEVGLFQYWTQNDNYEKQFNQERAQNIQILTLTEFKSVYILWFTGMAASFLCFAVEYIAEMSKQEPNFFNKPFYFG